MHLSHKPSSVVETAIPCCVCGGTANERLFRPPHAPGPVVRCRECGMVYVSPREDVSSLITDGSQFDAFRHLRDSSDLRELADCWESGELGYRLEERPALAFNHRAALAQIEGLGAPNRRLLDFGAGWGFFVATANEEGWSATGLEPLPGRGVYARSQGLDMVTDTLREGTFAPESFGVVTAFQVFEHLPDPAAELAKIRRILAPGGLVVIEVPNIDTPLSKVMRGRHRHFVHDHLWFFSPKTLEAFLRRQGFEPVATTFPTRTLSLRHLSHSWLPRYLPPPLAQGVQQLVDRAGARGRVVPVNLRDIVMAVGRKR